MDLKEKLHRAIVQAGKGDGINEKVRGPRTESCLQELNRNVTLFEKDMPDCNELFKELAQRAHDTALPFHVRIHAP